MEALACAIHSALQRQEIRREASHEKSQNMLGRRSGIFVYVDGVPSAGRHHQEYRAGPWRLSGRLGVETRL